MEFPNDKEMALFVGENADKFMYRWQPLLRGGKTNAKFNYAALFLGPYWFAYRKMYKESLIIALFGIVLYMILKIMLKSWDPFENIENISAENRDLLKMYLLLFPAYLNGILLLPVYFMVGLLSNKWYLQHMTQTIESIKLKRLADDDYLKAIENAGGTNGIAVVIVVFCSAIVNLVILNITLSGLISK